MQESIQSSGLILRTLRVLADTEMIYASDQIQHEFHYVFNFFCFSTMKMKVSLLPQQKLGDWETSDNFKSPQIPRFRFRSSKIIRAKCAYTQGQCISWLPSFEESGSSNWLKGHLNHVSGCEFMLTVGICGKRFGMLECSTWPTSRVWKEENFQAGISQQEISFRVQPKFLG